MANTWETIERELHVAMPLPVAFQVRETGSRFEAKTSDLGTPIHVVAPSREKALFRLERLVSIALARLVSERVRAAS